MCAGDTAFHNVDSVDITLTREQAKHLRRVMNIVYCIAEHTELSKRILEQLPKESA